MINKKRMVILKIIFILYVAGLLIEPNVKSYRQLISKNRKAKSINACVSSTHRPELVSFINADGISGIKGMFLTIKFFVHSGVKI